MEYRRKPNTVKAYRTNKVVVCHTNHGKAKADIGDYIITGYDGEEYPCTAEVFENMYEPVSEPRVVYVCYDGDDDVMKIYENEEDAINWVGDDRFNTKGYYAVELE